MGSHGAASTEVRAVPLGQRERKLMGRLTVGFTVRDTVGPADWLAVGELVGLALGLTMGDTVG